MRHAECQNHRCPMCNEPLIYEARHPHHGSFLHILRKEPKEPWNTIVLHNPCFKLMNNLSFEDAMKIYDKGWWPKPSEYGLGYISLSFSFLARNLLEGLKSGVRPGVRDRNPSREPRFKDKLAESTIGLAEAQNWRCCYCTNEMIVGHPTRHPTREHLIPRSIGGHNDFDNIVVACAWCNEVRDSLDLEDVILYLEHHKWPQDHHCSRSQMRSMITNRVRKIRTKLIRFAGKSESMQDSLAS